MAPLMLFLCALGCSGIPSRPDGSACFCFLLVGIGRARHARTINSDRIFPSSLTKQGCLQAHYRNKVPALCKSMSSRNHCKPHDRRQQLTWPFCLVIHGRVLISTTATSDAVLTVLEKPIVAHNPRHWHNTRQSTWGGRGRKDF